MNTQGMNLFIVDDNQLMVTGLRNYLANRFGVSLNISTFLTGESALEKVDENTSIVILDYFLDGEDGKEVLKAIKKINPKTEVIMLSSNEDIGVAVDLFRNGAADYVVKGEKSLRKVTSLVYNILTYPVRVIVREFGISKFLATFLLTFLIMGFGVYLALRYFN